jgi:short-subunit dehydrogenase
VKTLVVPSDMSLGEEEHIKIFRALEGLDIGVLSESLFTQTVDTISHNYLSIVNNVGTADGLPNFLENMSQQQVRNLVMLNVYAAASMTHQILPGMKKRGRGLIINNSSYTSYTLLPYGNLYGASKVCNITSI